MAVTRQLQVGVITLGACLFYALGFAGRVGAYLSGKAPGFQDMLDKLLGHYRVDYVQFGFIRRGLIGTIYAPLPDGYEIYFAHALNALAALAILWIILDLSRYCKGMGVIWMIGLAISPFMFCQISYDMARFDPVLFVMLILSLRLLIAGRDWGVVIVTILGVLIHELYLFFGLPVIVAAAMTRLQGAGLGPQIRAALNSPLILATVGSSALLAVLLAQMGGVSDGAMAAVGESNLAWNRAFLNIRWDGDAVETGAMMLWLVLIYLSYLGFLSLNGLSDTVLRLAPLPSLALFLFGFDYPRWVLLFFLACLALVYFLMLSRGARLPERLSWRTAWPLVLFLPMGPIGYIDFFPYVQEVLTRLF
ncbi:MAG: hypothetical protein AAF503_13920 [Pseudomonadota bacterium]